jgi:hypothetical protein
MRRTTFVLAVAAALGLVVQPAFATKPTSAPKPKTTVAKTQAPKSQAPKAPKAPTAHTAKAPKTTTAPKSASAASGKAPKTTTTVASPSPTTTGTWTPTNPVAEKLMTKPNQLAKLQSLLPAGTDLNLATAGFKNFGLLNAAVNNCINHNISFADLKAAMTGIRLDGTKTGLAPVSLGQAKKQLQTTTTAPSGDSRE